MTCLAKWYFRYLIGLNERTRDARALRDERLRSAARFSHVGSRAALPYCERPGSDGVHTPAGSGWLLRAGCWRTVCTGSCKRDGKLNSFGKPSARSDCTAVRRMLCKDAHQMHAAVGAQTGARIVRTAAVCLDAKSGDGRCPDCAFLCSVLAAMVHRPAGDGWSLSARVIAEPCAGAGERRVARWNRFERQAARWTCAAVRRVPCKDAQQMHAAVGATTRQRWCAHLLVMVGGLSSRVAAESFAWAGARRVAR